MEKQIEKVIQEYAANLVQSIFDMMIRDKKYHPVSTKLYDTGNLLLPRKMVKVARRKANKNPEKLLKSDREKLNKAVSKILSLMEEQK